MGAVQKPSAGDVSTVQGLLAKGLASGLRVQGSEFLGGDSLGCSYSIYYSLCELSGLGHEGAWTFLPCGLGLDASWFSSVRLYGLGLQGSLGFMG